MQKLKIQLILLSLTLILATLCANTLVNADEVSIDQDAVYVYDNTMSPYCPGRTLGACPSEDARMLREEIRGMLKAGYSREAVVNQMQMRYGFEVRGVPSEKGFGALAWIFPLIFVLFGLVIIVVFLRKSKNIDTTKETES
jgi:cytochrome c-type biogenesis protein CcmH/NrfF